MEMKVTDVSEQKEGLSDTQEQLLEATNKPAQYTLSNGKTIKFRKPPGIVSMQIAEILGEQSLNPALNIYYRMAFSLVEIDGMPVRTPKTRAEIMAGLQRLGDEEAFAEALQNFNDFVGINFTGDDAAKK